MRSAASASPPEAGTPGGTAPRRAAVPAVLRKRGDFLAAARALRSSKSGLVLQARRRDPAETASGVRVGFTCSKKVGNAVARNRAKRRLRAVAREILADEGRPGWDYVLIGRRDATASLPYPRLCADLRAALAAVHGR